MNRFRGDKKREAEVRRMSLTPILLAKVRKLSSGLTVESGFPSRRIPECPGAWLVPEELENEGEPAETISPQSNQFPSLAALAKRGAWSAGFTPAQL